MKTEEMIDGIVAKLLADYEDDRAINKTDLAYQPNKEAILNILKKLFKIIYPGYYHDRSYKLYSVRNDLAATIEDVTYNLHKQVFTVFKYCNTYPYKDDRAIDSIAQEKVVSFLDTIPSIREYLDTDLQATLDGDPAAESKDEIILCYPGIYAITVYRIAHELVKLDIPMLPRIMTEHAHNLTGIDINPGATIGKYFFIDHGTGIVIGETTVIGEHVKIYQGVTLGALSTKGGQTLKSIKRHPTIGNNVTIYSGASILGGDTVIEDNVVVGGNAFITKSVEKDTQVIVKKPELKESKI